MASARQSVPQRRVGGGRAPVRPAPPPPPSAAAAAAAAAAKQKKKGAPPPRPPPPKIKCSTAAFDDTDLLIDWNAPAPMPSTSPATPATHPIDPFSPKDESIGAPGRASSDGLSLLSFGSDSSGGGGSGGGGVATLTLRRVESGFDESEPDLWSDSTPAVHNAVQVAVKAFSMPTIIRPKTTRGPSQTASSTSTSTSLLDPAPSVRWPTPESVLILPASAKATDDWNNSVLSDDYSPPEPSMPPPPAPVGVAAPHVIGLATPQAEALYDYSAGHSDDLNFSVGDRIELVRRIDADWLYGRRGAETGMFPANFVRVLVPLLDEQHADDVDAHRRQNDGYDVVAQWPWTGVDAGDLSLQEGDVVHVTSDPGHGWLVGRCRGRDGQFPKDYVRRL